MHLRFDEHAAPNYAMAILLNGYCLSHAEPIEKLKSSLSGYKNVSLKRCKRKRHVSKIKIPSTEKFYFPSGKVLTYARLNIILHISPTRSWYFFLQFVLHNYAIWFKRITQKWLNVWKCINYTVHWLHDSQKGNEYACKLKAQKEAPETNNQQNWPIEYNVEWKRIKWRAECGRRGTKRKALQCMSVNTNIGIPIGQKSLSS